MLRTVQGIILNLHCLFSKCCNFQSTYVFLSVNYNLINKSVLKCIYPLSQIILFRVAINSDVAVYACSISYFCLCQNINKDMCLQCDHNLLVPVNVKWLEGAWPQTSCRAAVYITWHGMARHGMIWHGIWHDMTWHDMTYQPWHGMTLWYPVWVICIWKSVRLISIVWPYLIWCLA